MKNQNISKKHIFRPLVALFLIYCINLPTLATFSNDGLITQPPANLAVPENIQPLTNTQIQNIAQPLNNPSTGINHNISILNSIKCSSNSGSSAFFFKNSSFTVNNSSLSSHSTTDLNNDNNIDLSLISSSTSTNNFLGDGKGNFSNSTPITTKASSSFIYSSDINNDNLKDILLLSKTENTFSVLSNNDELNFSESLSFGELNSPSQIATGDINNDGLIDSFVLDNDALYLYLNFGDPDTYLFGFPLELPFIPKSFSLADLNYDGNLDIACTDSTSKITILYGNGESLFNSTDEINLSGNASSILITDLNNDSKLDLITSVSNQLAIAFGNSTNKFDSPIYLNLPSNSLFINVGNFNGDCFPDLLSANDNKTFSILKNNGNKSFSPSIEFPLTSNPLFLSVSDLNNDLKSDIVFSFPNEVKIYLASEPPKENTSNQPIDCKNSKPICTDGVAPTCTTGINPLCAKIGSVFKFGCLVNGMIVFDTVTCPQSTSTSSSSGNYSTTSTSSSSSGNFIISRSEPTSCVSAKPKCENNTPVKCTSGGNPFCGLISNVLKYGCISNGKIVLGSAYCEKIVENNSSSSSSSGTTNSSSSSSSGNISAACIPNQWASAATATDSNSMHPASNIVGPPQCTAYNSCPTNAFWSSAFAGEASKIVITFPTPSLASSILIRELYYPGFVKTITLIDQNNNTIGSPINVNDNATSSNNDLIISFPKTSIPVSKVSIDTLPTSQIKYSIIDAVQLRCSNTISSSSSSGNPICGNNTIEGNEQCEGSGQAQCSANQQCQNCMCVNNPICGNRLVEGNEECDAPGQGQCLFNYTCMNCVCVANPTSSSSSSSSSSSGSLTCINRQWASNATATNSYAGYPASNIIGSPEFINNGGTLWVSENAGLDAQVEVTFNIPTLADSILIKKGYNHNFVKNITLKDENDTVISSGIYVSDNSFNTDLTVSFPKTAVPVKKVLIDTRPSNLTTPPYSAINAVELHCPGVCGNNIKEDNEQCDGANTCPYGSTCVNCQCNASSGSICPEVCLSNSPPWSNITLCKTPTTRISTRTIPNGSINNSIDFEENSLFVGITEYSGMATNNGRFSIFDISNTNTLNLIGSTLLNQTSIYKIKVRGNFAYIIDGAQTKLIILDISNPQLPYQVSSTPINTGFDLDIQENKLFLTSFSNVIEIYDISNPASPTLLGKANQPTTTRGKQIIVHNNFAYIIGDQLTIFNVTNPTNPTLASNTNIVIKCAAVPPSGSISCLQVSASQVFINENYLFVPVLYYPYDKTESYLVGYEISYPAAPRKTLELKISDDFYPSYDMKNNYLFVNNPSTQKVDVYNISGQSFNPRIASIMTFGEIGEIVAKEKYLYIFNNDKPGEFSTYQFNGCPSTSGSTFLSSSSSSSSGALTNTSSSSSSSSSGNILRCTSGSLCSSGLIPNCPQGTTFSCLGGTQEACCIDSSFNCKRPDSPTCIQPANSSNSSSSSSSSGSSTQPACILNQWASSATATNSHPNYPASNIVGSPECTSYNNCPGYKIWASATAGQPATVEATFQTPTLADSILIKESLYPGFVKKVTLKDANNNIIGLPITVTDTATTTNPDLLVSFTKTTVPVSKVSIDTIPASTTLYSSIDAIQIRCSSGTSGSTQTCGNNVKEGSEACDGSGQAQCNAGFTCMNCQCSANPICGNNVKEGNEACDGSGQAQCNTGFTCMNCQCSANPVCGNNVKEGNEACDGSGQAQCNTGFTCLNCQCIQNTKPASLCKTESLLFKSTSGGCKNLSNNIVFSSPGNTPVISSFKNQNEANAYCENLNEGGFDDWRLPNKLEIETVASQRNLSDFINYNYINSWTNTSTTSGSYNSFSWSTNKAQSIFPGDSKLGVHCIRGTKLSSSGYCLPPNLSCTNNSECCSNNCSNYFCRYPNPNTVVISKEGEFCTDDTDCENYTFCDINSHYCRKNTSYSLPFKWKEMKVLDLDFRGAIKELGKYKNKLVAFGGGSAPNYEAKIQTSSDGKNWTTEGYFPTGIQTGSLVEFQDKATFCGSKYHSSPSNFCYQSKTTNFIDGFTLKNTIPDLRPALATLKVNGSEKAFIVGNNSFAGGSTPASPVVYETSDLINWTPAINNANSQNVLPFPIQRGTVVKFIDPKTFKEKLLTTYSFVGTTKVAISEDGKNWTQIKEFPAHAYEEYPRLFVFNNKVVLVGFTVDLTRKDNLGRPLQIPKLFVSKDGGLNWETQPGLPVLENNIFVDTRPVVFQNRLFIIARTSLASQCGSVVFSFPYSY